MQCLPARHVDCSVSLCIAGLPTALSCLIWHVPHNPDCSRSVLTSSSFLPIRPSTPASFSLSINTHVFNPTLGLLTLEGLSDVVRYRNIINYMTWHLVLPGMALKVAWVNGLVLLYSRQNWLVFISDISITSFYQFPAIPIHNIYIYIYIAMLTNKLNETTIYVILILVTVDLNVTLLIWSGSNNSQCLLGKQNKFNLPSVLENQICSKNVIKIFHQAKDMTPIAFCFFN